MAGSSAADPLTERQRSRHWRFPTHGGRARLILAASLALPLHACYPVVLSREHVEPATRSVTVDAQWDPEVGPDLHLEYVHRFKQALGRQSDRIAFADAETVWRTWFPQREADGIARVGEILSAIGAAQITRGEVQYLVVLGEPTAVQSVKSSEKLFPFYAEVQQTHSADAALIDLKEDRQERKTYWATAEGIEKSVYAPVSVLMFARLYKLVDTESSALEGLAKAVASALASSDRPRLTVVVLATPGTSGGNFVNCGAGNGPEEIRRWSYTSKCH